MVAVYAGPSSLRPTSRIESGNFLMKRTFTRQELYDLVWSTPISKLAEQLEISDRGLAKTCARYHIAVPGRGYWAKIEAGQSATKTPLWKVDNPSLHTVHVGGAKQQINPYVAFAIEAAQKAVEKAKTRPAAASNPSVKSREDVAGAASVAAFEPVRRPHISISGLALALKAAQPDRDGEVAVMGIRVHRDSRSRVIAFLHHLAIALERRGISLAQGERGLKASISPDDISFEISEGRQRVKHEPSPTELKKEQDYERKRAMASKRGQWLFPEKFWPEFDYDYSGKLTFEINNWADGARKKWSDGKYQFFETMVDSIADGILYHLAFDKARREEREKEERRRRHLAHRRELHKKRKEREAKRIKFLADLADYQQEAARLKSVIESASKVEGDTLAEYQRMIEWSKARLAYLDAQNEPETLAANLRSENLFPHEDELFDPEGDPPPKQEYWD
ncbi:hypothetical protein D3C87_1142210 [compost metagenome]